MSSQSHGRQFLDKRRKSPLWARITLALGAVLMLVSGSTLVFINVAESKVNAAIPDHQLADGAGTEVKHADIKGAKNILLASLDTRPSWSATHLASTPTRSSSCTSRRIISWRTCCPFRATRW